MKFTLATLATIAIASAAPIQVTGPVQVAVLDPIGNNIGYLSTKFGANFGEGFVDSTPSTYDISDTNILTFTPENGNQYALQYLGDAGTTANLMTFANRYSNPVPLDIGDNAKIVNYNWWACKNINTPGAISDTYPEVVGTNDDAAPFSTCEKVQLALIGVIA